MYQETVRTREAGPCPHFLHSLQELWAVKVSNSSYVWVGKRKDFIGERRLLVGLQEEWNERSLEDEKLHYVRVVGGRGKKRGREWHRIRVQDRLWVRDQRRNVVVCAQKSMARNHNNPDFRKSHGREEMRSMLHILNTHGRFLCHVHVSQCCSCLHGSDVDTFMS